MSSWGMKKHVAKYRGLRNETVEFYVHMTVHRNKSLYNETNRRTDFQIYSGTQL